MKIRVENSGENLMRNMIMLGIISVAIRPVVAGVILLLSGMLAAGAGESSLNAVEKQFRELPMEARRLTGPLFWMHGDETKEQLEGELKKIVEGGNGIFTAEPRPHKDWLGNGWYRDLEICLEFARKNDLKMIIYDDWWWPSQMMGGRVPPQYGSKHMEAASVTIEGPKAFNEATYGDSNLIAIVAGRVADGDTIDGNSLVNLTASVKKGTLSWDVPAGKWNLMKFTWRFNGTQGRRQKYVSVDGASPDCVAWFIKTVYQPHYDRFKAALSATSTTSPKLRAIGAATYRCSSPNANLTWPNFWSVTNSNLLAKSRLPHSKPT